MARIRNLSNYINSKYMTVEWGKGGRAPSQNPSAPAGFGAAV